MVYKRRGWNEQGIQPYRSAGARIDYPDVLALIETYGS